MKGRWGLDGFYFSFLGLIKKEEYVFLYLVFVIILGSVRYCFFRFRRNFFYRFVYFFDFCEFVFFCVFIVIVWYY